MELGKSLNKTGSYELPMERNGNGCYYLEHYFVYTICEKCGMPFSKEIQGIECEPSKTRDDGIA
jgi:hypothetical protein